MDSFGAEERPRLPGFGVFLAKDKKSYLPVAAAAVRFEMIEEVVPSAAPHGLLDYIAHLPFEPFLDPPSGIG